MNGSRIKERGISLLASLFFHVVILFLFVRLVPPVRVYLFRHAADVRIVDPGIISFPQIAGDPDTPSSGSPSSQVSFVELPEEEGGGRQQVEPSPGVVYLKNLNLGRTQVQATEKFDLIPSPRSEKKEGNFSLSISRKDQDNPQLGEEENRVTPVFSAINAPALASLPFNRVITDRKGVMPSRQIDIAHRLGEYNLSPWVKQVVDKIRNNWTPPPIDESIAIGKVKILFVVGREGNLIGLEIVSPSAFPFFDQTTTGAIRSSVPFPPLPADFPDERLEAYLVFEFHE